MDAVRRIAFENRTKFEFANVQLYTKSIETIVSFKDMGAPTEVVHMSSSKERDEWQWNEIQLISGYPNRLKA